MHVKVYVVHWMSSEKIRRQYFQLSNTGVGHLLPGSTSWERPGLPEFFFVFVETLKLLWFRGSNAKEVRKKSLDKDFVWQTFEMGERERDARITQILYKYTTYYYIYISGMYIIHIRMYIYIYIYICSTYSCVGTFQDLFDDLFSSTGPPGLHFWAVSPWCFTSAAWPYWWLTAPEHPPDVPDV